MVIWDYGAATRKFSSRRTFVPGDQRELIRAMTQDSGRCPDHTACVLLRWDLVAFSICMSVTHCPANRSVPSSHNVTLCEGVFCLAQYDIVCGSWLNLSKVKLSLVRLCDSEL